MTDHVSTVREREQSTGGSPGRHCHSERTARWILGQAEMVCPVPSRSDFSGQSKESTDNSKVGQGHFLGKERGLKNHYNQTLVRGIFQTTVGLGVGAGSQA